MSAERSLWRPGRVQAALVAAQPALEVRGEWIISKYKLRMHRINREHLLLTKRIQGSKTLILTHEENKTVTFGTDRAYF